MPGVLALLVGFILPAPTTLSRLPYKTGSVIDSVAYRNYLEDSNMYYQNNPEYKRNLPAIILIAFGGWAGAGAAYFFGRENLCEPA